MKTLAIVFFPVKNIGDAVVSIGNATYPASATAANLPSTEGQFFHARDINGNTILCTVKATDIGLPAVFFDGIANYTADAIIAPPTVVVEFIGGRPNERR